MTGLQNHVLAQMFTEQRNRSTLSSRHRSALASTIRRWLSRPQRRPIEPAAPPVARMLRTYRDLAERIAAGLEADAVRPEAVRAVEQLLADARPRTDDLRRAVFLLEYR